MDFIKHNVKAKLDELINQLFTQINDMEASLVEKDKRISQLSNVLTQTTQELEVLKVLYKQKNNEINLLNADFEKSNKPAQVSNQQIVIITRPEDVFNQPQDIINWYFKELDLEKLSFSDLIVNMKGLLELLDYDSLDKILDHISDHRLKLLNKTELEQLLILMEAYIKGQINTARYSTFSLFHFMESIYNQRWISILRDFVKTNKSIIETLILKQDVSSIALSPSIYLLKLYLNLELDFELETWLDKIFRFVVDTECVELKDAIELLYISFIYKRENTALDFMPFIRNKLEEDDVLPELEAIKVFQRAYAKEKNPEHALLILNSEKRKVTLVEPSIKTKALDEMAIRLKKVAEGSHMQNQSLQDKFLGNKQFKKTETFPRQFESVYSIKNGISFCPYDSSRLEMINTRLAKYSDSSQTTINQYIPVELLYCPKCNKAYINRSMENKLIRIVSLKQLDIIPWVNEVSRVDAQASLNIKPSLNASSIRVTPVDAITEKKSSNNKELCTLEETGEKKSHESHILNTLIPHDGEYSIEKKDLKFDSVIRIKNGVTKCPFDDNTLKLTGISLARYTDKDKKTISYFMQFKGLYCSKCKKAFINTHLLNRLMSLCSLKYINVITDFYEIGDSNLKSIHYDFSNGVGNYDTGLIEEPNRASKVETEDEILKKIGDLKDPLEVLKWLDKNGY